MMTINKGRQHLRQLQSASPAAKILAVLVIINTIVTQWKLLFIHHHHHHHHHENLQGAPYRGSAASCSKCQ